MPHCAPPRCQKASWIGCSPPSVLSEPLDGAHAGALRLARCDEAGVDELAVEEHRAGAALPFAAPLLRSGEREVLAQDVEQALHRRDVDRPPPPVHFESQSQVDLPGPAPARALQA